MQYKAKHKTKGWNIAGKPLHGHAWPTAIYFFLFLLAVRLNICL